MAVARLESDCATALAELVANLFRCSDRLALLATCCSPSADFAHCERSFPGTCRVVRAHCVQCQSTAPEPGSRIWAQARNLKAQVDLSLMSRAQPNPSRSQRNLGHFQAAAPPHVLSTARHLLNGRHLVETRVPHVVVALQSEALPLHVSSRKS